MQEGTIFLITIIIAVIMLFVSIYHLVSDWRKAIYSIAISILGFIVAAAVYAGLSYISGGVLSSLFYLFPLAYFILIYVVIERLQKNKAKKNPQDNIPSNNL